MSNENTPDEATQWYQELKQSALRNVDAQLDQLSQGHAALETAFNGLDGRAEAAHDSLDTRQLIEIERERSRLLSEAAQIQNGYQALQAERQRLEQQADPKFDEILSNSSAPGQMFLRVHRHQLKNDPAKLRQLLHADARCRAVGLKPDSKQYFSALETAVGLSADDRSLDDFKGDFDESTNTYKVDRAPREKAKDKFEPTAEQKWMAKELAQHGIPEKDYLAQCANPFSEAHTATVEVEPADFDTGAHKSMEVSFGETPKKPSVDASRYKPNPATSTTLSKAELDLIDNMTAGQGDKARDEMRKSFAANKIALHQGKAGHYMLYDAKLRAEGHR